MTVLNPKQYWEDRLKDNWGLDGVGYIGLGRHFNKWLYRLQRQVFLRHVIPMQRNWSEADVLDIGSGTGFYGELWKQLGVKSLFLTDLTSAAVVRLKQKFPDSSCLDLDIGAPLTETLGTRRFDCISAFAVLYHILDDHRYRTAFQNVTKLLKPGGLFIFSENLLHKDAIHTPTQVSRSLTHVFGVLREFGLSVKLRAPLFVLMNFPVDSGSKLWEKAWHYTTLPVRKIGILGWFLGALLYPADLVLTSVLKEGPSTEIVICEKGLC
ncbi:MAG: class I SAM-dependent methyltransferase [Armatimonadetes bacterium]|nr:class I SAM-dependent methyltransferase [Armatimonadota bacterium]